MRHEKEVPADYDEPYVNEHCPGQCGTEHDSPEPDWDGQWRCPETGHVFFYEGPDYPEDYAEVGNWTYSRWGDQSYLIDGEWYNDPWSAGYIRCESCDTWTQDYIYDDYDDYAYCERCYHARSDIEGASNMGCPSCRRDVTHWHPVTERATCADHAGDGYEPIPVLEEAA